MDRRGSSSRTPFVIQRLATRTKERPPRDEFNLLARECLRCQHGIVQDASYVYERGPLRNRKQRLPSNARRNDQLFDFSCSQTKSLTIEHRLNSNQHIIIANLVSKPRELPARARSSERLVLTGCRHEEFGRSIHLRRLVLHYGDSALNCLPGITVTVRLIAFPLRSGSAFARPQPALGQPLDATEKSIVAERPADAFGGAQARE